MANSIDLIRHRMTRADETMMDARILADSERWNACVNRLYYACFYSVSALLLCSKLSSSKHTGVRSLFNQNYVKNGKVPKELAHIYNDLFERRQEGDYIDFIVFHKDQVIPWIDEVKMFLGYIRDLIHRDMENGNEEG